MVQVNVIELKICFSYYFLFFFFETSHLDTAVASVRIQTHTYTTHTHTSHTPQVYNQTYNYTQISRRVLKEITRVIEAPATGASQSLCGSTR